MADYTIADQLDFTHDDEGVTIHVWFPGERHLRMSWEQWDAMNAEVNHERPALSQITTMRWRRVPEPAPESIVAVVDSTPPAPPKPKRIRNRKK